RVLRRVDEWDRRAAILLHPADSRGRRVSDRCAACAGLKKALVPGVYRGWMYLLPSLAGSQIEIPVPVVAF
ncbi:hypothetical protein ABFV48_26580, partial [Pseudomonas syringae]|uniref:hypothetical protein n=1 Tax=Pseudomonas syringae TaxID=317 RepID=UPI0034D97414